jgi:hypothetical protein
MTYIHKKTKRTYSVIGPVLLFESGVEMGERTVIQPLPSISDKHIKDQVTLTLYGRKLVHKRAGHEDKELNMIYSGHRPYFNPRNLRTGVLYVAEITPSDDVMSLLPHPPAYIRERKEFLELFEEGSNTGWSIELPSIKPIIQQRRSCGNRVCFCDGSCMGLKDDKFGRWL